MPALIAGVAVILYLPGIAFVGMFMYIAVTHGIMPMTAVAAKMGLGAGFVTFAGWPISKAVWRCEDMGVVRLVLPACLILLMFLRT